MNALPNALLWGAAFGCIAAVLRSRRLRWRPLAVAYLSVVTSCLVGATIWLLIAVLRNDYGIAYVAAQSRADSSGWYRIAAVWAGAEGSLLLFAAMLSTAVLMYFGRNTASKGAWVTAFCTLGLLAGTVALVANPFVRVALPAIRGAGLTPILEHPAMIYHPPLLYAGLVATAPPFLHVIGGAGSLLTVRRWVLVAWTLLTVGLATGANWAYVELGWGGYWAWDPVENTVLIPWLVLTAALHAWHLDAPRVVLQALVGSPFVLVAFGAAVTRSGGLSSVHVFADAQSIGIALGALVVGLAIVLGWQLRFVAADSETSPAAVWESRSLRYTLVAAIGLFLLLAVTVLLGVAFPLAPSNDRILDSSYYTSIGGPLLVVGLVAMSFARTPGATWPTKMALARCVGGAAVGLAMAVGVGGAGWFALSASAAIGAAIAGHVSRALVTRSTLPMVLGHIGMIVLSVGIVGSSQAQSVRTLLSPGESVEVAGYTVIYESFAVTDGPRFQSEQSTATVTVGQSGSRAFPVEPGLVSYPDRAVVLAETALHSTPWRDIQVVMRTISDDGTATFDVAVRPGLMMVWWGAALIAFAGLAGALARRSTPTELNLGS